MRKQACLRPPQRVAAQDLWSLLLQEQRKAKEDRKKQRQRKVSTEMDANAEMVSSEEQLQAASPDQQDEDVDLTAAETPVSGEMTKWHLVTSLCSVFMAFQSSLHPLVVFPGHFLVSLVERCCMRSA